MNNTTANVIFTAVLFSVTFAAIWIGLWDLGAKKRNIRNRGM